MPLWSLVGSMNRAASPFFIQTHRISSILFGRIFFENREQSCRGRTSLTQTRILRRCRPLHRHADDVDRITLHRHPIQTPCHLCQFCKVHCHRSHREDWNYQSCWRRRLGHLPMEFRRNTFPPNLLVPSAPHVKEQRSLGKCRNVFGLVSALTW